MSESLGTSYQGYRQEASAADALRQLRGLAGETEQPAPPPSNAEPGAVRQDPAGPGTTGNMIDIYVEGEAVRPGNRADNPAADRGTVLGDVVDAAGRVARNVGDATKQLVGGPVDAVRELFRAMDDIGDWASGNQPVAEADATLANSPGRTIARNIPNVAAPDTPAGKVVHDLAQFVAGFAGGGRIVGGTRTALRAMSAGAMADFFAMPANRERLTALWSEAGLPPNALTDFLATNPNDSAALNRLKNAAEGAALGGAIDGLLAAARGFRAAAHAHTGRQRAGNPGQAAARMAQQAQGEALVQQAMGALGGAEAPLVARDVMNLGSAPASRAAVPIAGDPGARMAASAAATSDAATGVSATTSARGLAGAADETATHAGPHIAPVDNTSAIRAARDTGPVYINWARIEAAEDVQAVLRDTAEAFRGDINAAGREVQSNAATSRLADDLGLTVEQLLSRRAGEPLNAETALAARRLMVASGERLTALAQAAAGAGAGPADEYAFRRMLAVHHAIQSEVLAARRETARALQAWAIPAGGGAEQARAIRDVLEAYGGSANAQAIARRLVAAQEGGATPATLNAFIGAGAMARTLGAVQEYWINALLSSPKTHLVNMGSNAFVAAQQIVERRIAQAMGSSVAEGEAAEMAYGAVEGLRDAFRLAWRSYRDGTGEIGTLLGKVDAPRDPAISAAGLGVQQGSGLGQAVDFIGHSIIRQPTRLLGAEDAFFKSIGYRMELRAGARRMARDELLSEGTLQPGSREFAAELLTRRDGFIANPPEALRMQAADQALYQTFNRATYTDGVNVVQGLMQLRQNIPPLTFILPFVRTPGNVISYSFERTPLAPLVGQWRADIAAGGARRDLALARLGTGSAVMAVAFDYADRGMVSGKGPDDPGEVENLRNQGWQPYSIRVGDQWVAYDRADPLGFVAGFAADMADLFRRREIEPEEVDEVQELVAAAIATVSRSVVDRTWMQGVAGFIEAIDNPEQGAATFMRRQAGSFVPAIVGVVEQAVSPARSEANSMAEALMARIPGLSDQLSPARNVWGEVVVPETVGRAVFDALSPVRVSDVRESPIDAELERLNLPLSRIPKRVDFDGAQVNLSAYPGAYDDYVRLAGNEWVNPGTGKGLRDTLNEMVQGQGPFGPVYAGMTDGRDGTKAQMIRSLVQQFREGARQEVLRLHPDLAAVVAARRVERVQQRTGQAGAAPQMR